MADRGFKHALETSREIELTVTGRTSGRQLSTPLRFVTHDETPDLVPVRGPDAEWFKNLLKTPAIRLATADWQLSARATPISGAAAVERILDRFRTKYGTRDVEAFYPRHEVAVEVALV